MNKEQEKILAAEINKWFDDIKVDKRFWRRNVVGRVIKDRLNKLNHWKNYSVKKSEILPDKQSKINNQLLAARQIKAEKPEENTRPKEYNPLL